MKLSRNLLVAITLTSLNATAVPTFAQVHPVDINSKVPYMDDSPVNPTLSLGAGAYDIRPVSRNFVAWYPWSMVSFPLTCTDAAGCTDPYGYIHRYVFSINDDETFVWDEKYYPSMPDALAAAESAHFYLPSAADVTFYVDDSHYPDNTGGVALDIIPRLQVVPEPNPDETDPEDYCARNQDGLVVTFKNNSSSRPTPGTTIGVLFLEPERQRQTKPLAAIPVGGTGSLVFPIPEGCFEAADDCPFSIEWYDESVYGYCVS